MLSRIFYFARETSISLMRNISMSIAAILTIFVTLSLVGVATLVFFWNSAGAATVKKAVRFEVFLLPDANKSQIDNIRQMLEEDKKEGNVSKITFYSKEDAYKFFKKSFQDEKDLIKSISKEDLPVSFLVAPNKADDDFVKNLIGKYEAVPGVDKVIYADFKDDIQRATIINRTVGVFALVLLIASCVLVYNTVRLAVYARRREIEIMKLVGASNWFVQVPFMAEGAIQGLVGGVLACGSAYFFKAFVLDDHFSSFKGFAVSQFDLTLTILMVVVMGMLVGVLSSYIGLKRYLDV